MSTFDGLLQFLFKQFPIRKFGHIVCYSDIVVVEMHQLYVLFTLAGTQYKSDGLVLTIGHIILFEPTQIQLHLPLVGSLKFSKFQINGDKTTQTAVIKQ